MNLPLLRRDLSFLMSPILWACGALFGYIMATGASIDFAHGTGPSSLDSASTHVGWMLWLMFMAVANYFGGGRMWEIATPMHLALPVRAWDLWKARMLAMQLAITGSAIFACLAFWLRYEADLQAVQINLAFNAVCLILLAPILYHSARVRTYKWGMPLGIYLPLLTAIIWVLSRVGYKTPWPGVISLALSFVLLVTTYRRMPLTYPLGGRDEGAATWRGGAVATLVGTLERVPALGEWIRVDRLLRPDRTVSKSQLQFVLLLAVIINVFLLSLSAFALLLVLVALHALWFLRCLNGVSRAAYLPIERGRFFWHAMLPGYLLLAAAVWISAFILPTFDIGGGPSPSSVAAGVAYYILAWWLVLSASILAYATPPPTRRAWKLRYLTDPRLWIGLVLVGVPFLLHMSTWMAADEIMARPFPGPLADALPFSAAAYWALSVVLLVVTHLDLRRQFLGIELAAVRKGIEP